jgi:hypothetical protein
MDLIPGNMSYQWPGLVDEIPSRYPIEQLETPDQEAFAIDALALEQYHQICYWNLSRFRTFDCSTSATVNLSAIIVCSSGDCLKDLVEIVLFPDADVYLGDWRTYERVTGEVMEGGWTRYYDFILAPWGSVLTGCLPGSLPVIYLTAFSS